MKITHYAQLLTLACISTTLYASQEIVIKNAKKKHLAGIAALTHTIFYNDLKPIILAGYADNPLVQAGHTDMVLNEWLTIRNQIDKDSINDTVEKNNRLIIAQDKTNKNNILGFCSFQKKPKNETHRVYVSFLAVNQQVRQRGIGTQLLSQAINTFDDVESCELATLARDNESVQKFYEKRGFTNQGLITIDPRTPGTHLLYQHIIQK